MPGMAPVKGFGEAAATDWDPAGSGVPCLDIVILTVSRTTVRILCPCGPMVS